MTNITPFKHNPLRRAGWDIMCNIQRISYDVEKRCGLLELPPDNAPDMSSTIECFQSIDIEVRAIYTTVGDKRDTMYFFDTDTEEWTASPYWYEKHGDEITNGCAVQAMAYTISGWRGYGYASGVSERGVTVKRSYGEQHEAEFLLWQVRRVTPKEVARDWILKNTVKTKKTTRQHSSYGYKHLAECWSGVYVSNDDFIAAAIELGHTPAWLFNDSINCFFNMKLNKGYDRDKNFAR